MASPRQEHRRQVVLLLVLLGLVALLGTLALLVYHQYLSAVQAREAAGPALTAEAKIRMALAVRQVLFSLLLLVGIFAISSYAFLRWSRRFRNRLLRKPRPPTPSEDAWAMHRLPEDTDAAPDGEPLGSEPTGPEGGD